MKIYSAVKGSNRIDPQLNRPKYIAQPDFNVYKFKDGCHETDYI